jgi:ParB/RepB/Spo0J family partition protein
MIPVAKIRPEEGLSRKRERDGHLELCRSIQKFGVLTPISVRRAEDGSGDYLLIKGQGRTLACSVLGIQQIPAEVVDHSFDENQKVQQFLVENVARQKMSPVDRALLIAKARREGEETSQVADRFGVSASTVRRLEAQINGASPNEVAVLQRGEVSLTIHALVARWVSAAEREDILKSLVGLRISAKDLAALFVALGWAELSKLPGDRSSSARKWLFSWICDALARQPGKTFQERLCMAVLELPLNLPRPLPARRVAG